VNSSRPGRARRAGAIFVGFCAGLTALLSAETASAQTGTAVHGKLVVKGKAFSFTRAWLVRGPETSDETKPAAYLILSANDLSGAIKDCATLSCVLWDTVHEAAVLEPLDEKAESFWLRVVSSKLAKEYQLSGRRWTPAVVTHDRLSGRLQYAYTNTEDEADLEIDAMLIKEFPVQPSH
jgi:hypothetical protein